MVFKAHRDTQRRKPSAIAVIHALLNLGDVLCPAHRTRFLSNCLWQITKAEGRHKYDLRYYSQEALTAPRKELRHEHVYQRQKMIKELIRHPDRVESIVAKVVGCVVTKGEHAKLDAVDRQFPELEGWDRYRQAGISVVDTAGTPISR
jgi:hypothetical protein